MCFCVAIKSNWIPKTNGYSLLVRYYYEQFFLLFFHFDNRVSKLSKLQKRNLLLGCDKIVNSPKTLETILNNWIGKQYILALTYSYQLTNWVITQKYSWYLVTVFLNTNSLVINNIICIYLYIRLVLVRAKYGIFLGPLALQIPIIKIYVWKN